mgnify:CR=1 FL=1
MISYYKLMFMGRLSLACQNIAHFGVNNVFSQSFQPVQKLSTPNACNGSVTCGR